jgi:hypothetical protein
LASSRKGMDLHLTSAKCLSACSIHSLFNPDAGLTLGTQLILNPWYRSRLYLRTRTTSQLSGLVLVVVCSEGFSKSVLDMISGDEPILVIVLDSGCVGTKSISPEVTSFSSVAHRLDCGQAVTNFQCDVMGIHTKIQNVGNSSSLQIRQKMQGITSAEITAVPLHTMLCLHKMVSCNLFSSRLNVWSRRKGFPGFLFLWVDFVFSRDNLS